MSDLYIGAYWGPRQESAGQCAERMLACLTEFHGIGGVIASWYDKARNKRDANHRQEELQRPLHMWGDEELVRLFEGGRNRRDLDHSVIEELGFRATAWNWSEPKSASSSSETMKMTVTCGCYSHRVGNALVLDFPEVLGDRAEKESALKALMAVVRAWEPDWAGLISRASRNARQFTPGSPFVDWMIYLKQTNIDASELPSSASVVSVDGKGTIVITQDAPVDPSDQSHVQNVQAVESAILRGWPR
jgi:hypothetical protein